MRLFGSLPIFSTVSYDTHWIRALFEAGEVRPGFVLDDWHRVTIRLDLAPRERAFA